MQTRPSKNGSPPYSIAELSDGERNSLLIAASILTMKSESLVLIDEPERHLHRSIISPLLQHLFSSRSDCAFIKLLSNNDQKMLNVIKSLFGDLISDIDLV